MISSTEFDLLHLSIKGALLFRYLSLQEAIPRRKSMVAMNHLLFNKTNPLGVNGRFTILAFNTNNNNISSDSKVTNLQIQD